MVLIVFFTKDTIWEGMLRLWCWIFHGLLLPSVLQLASPAAAKYVVVPTPASGAQVTERFNIVIKNSANFSEHLERVQVYFPAVTVDNIYWQLVQHNYQGYTATVQHADMNSFQLTFQDQLKVFEVVTTVHAAGTGLEGEKLPFTPSFSRLEEKSNLVGGGFCYIAYETYLRHVTARIQLEESERDGESDSEGESERRDAAEASCGEQLACRTLPQTVYVLDSGIQAHHPSFTGRVTTAAWSPPSRHISAASEQHSTPNDTLPTSHLDEESTGNRHAHGTQVASLIGGRGFGVNPDVRLVDVRVLDDRGVGRTDDVLAALDFVTGQ